MLYFEKQQGKDRFQIQRKLSITGSERVSTKIVMQ